MKNHRVLERLSAANPIPGIEHVETDEYERFVSYFESRRVAMIDIQESQDDTIAAQPKRRTKPILVFTGALVAVVLAVGGSVLWLGSGTAQDPASEVTQPIVPTTAPQATTLPATTLPIADTTPTITFDGETASYSGPATFDENELTFRLVNTSDSVRIAFGWYLMSDETMSMDEVIAFAERHRGELYGIPPWIKDWNQIDFNVPPNSVLEESSREQVPTGKCLLYAYSMSDTILYPAAFITVNGS